MKEKIEALKTKSQYLPCGSEVHTKATSAILNFVNDKSNYFSNIRTLFFSKSTGMPVGNKLLTDEAMASSSFGQGSNTAKNIYK